MCNCSHFFHGKDSSRGINPVIFSNLMSALNIINSVSVFENGLAETKKEPEAIKYFFFLSLQMLRLYFFKSEFNMGIKRK